MKKLTKKQIKKFVDNDGCYCPVCGSDNIYPIETYGSYSDAYSRSSCMDCEAIFNAVMKLVGVVVE